MLRRFLTLTLAGASLAAWAQVVPTDPDWKELEAPPPPPLRTTGLIPVEVPGTSLRFGVDPESVTVSSDGVVRYVIVATSPSGTVNAMYEGIRCSTGKVRVFARHNPASGWVQTGSTEWQELQTTPNTRYSLQVARSGACMGHAPNRNVPTILRDLRSGVDRRFTGN